MGLKIEQSYCHNPTALSNHFNSTTMVVRSKIRVQCFCVVWVDFLTLFLFSFILQSDSNISICERIWILKLTIFEKMYNSCTKSYLRFSLFYLLILFASFEKYIYISCRKLYLKFNSSILFDSFEKYIIPLSYLYL